MRVFKFFVFATIFSMASLVHAETLDMRLTERLISANARAGVQALRDLPQTADVRVGTRRRAFVADVRGSQQPADGAVTERLAQTGPMVTRVRHAGDASGLRARPKRSAHRYSKWH